jgi:molecular chaperone GrpE
MTTIRGVRVVATAALALLAVFVLTGTATTRPRLDGSVPGAPGVGTEQPNVETSSSPGTGSDGIPWWTLAVTGVLAAALGAGCCLVVTRRPRDPDAAGAPARRAARVSRVPPIPAPASAADADLAALVGSVIEARDLLDPQSVMAQRLGTALARSGVSEFAPIGQPFDPARHHAVDAAPTADPARVDLIAEVQRVGYFDATHMIRPPEVVVFRLEPAP